MPSPSDIEELIATLTTNQSSNSANWGRIRRVVDKLGGKQRILATGSIRDSVPRRTTIDAVTLNNGQIRMEIYVEGPDIHDSAGQSAKIDFSKSEAHRLVQVISCLLAKTCVE